MERHMGELRESCLDFLLSVWPVFVLVLTSLLFLALLSCLFILEDTGQVVSMSSALC